MFERERILAFIPARSGSKGLKNKNIRNFFGKPLIAWTIDASLRSKYIDRTVVSTECPKIAGIAKKFGSDVPFLRPSYLAKDHSMVLDAIRHCIRRLSFYEKDIYDFVIVLYPTAPLRSHQHIDEAIEFFFQHRKKNFQKNFKDTLVSVKTLPQKMGWMMKKDRFGYIRYCFRVPKSHLSRQNLEPYYLPNGAIYFGPVSAIKKSGFYTKNTLCYVMKEEESVDIDTIEEFQLAEKFFRRSPNHPGVVSNRLMK